MAYASQTDLTNLGMPQAALATLSSTQINSELQAASDFADGFFRARWGMNAVPLAAWDTSVTRATAQIAAYYLVRLRGYDARSTADQRFKDGHDEAVVWLDKVQRQQAHPNVTLAATAAPLQPIFTSTSVIDLSTGDTGNNRGW